MIYIIGAGAIGKALAVFLTDAGQQVSLIRGSVDHEPSKMETISVINQNGEAFRAEVEVATLSHFKRLDGPVVIATKAFANEKLAIKLKALNGSFPVVLLQNGLNVENPFSEFNEVYRCVLFSTSQISPNGVVSFKTVTSSPIGVITGTTTPAKEVVNVLNTPNFEFHYDADIQQHIWTKTIINCAFNSLCPLLEVDNGIFFKNTGVFQLAKTIIAEGVQVAKQYAINLDATAIEKKLIFISEKAEGQLISTYEDLNKKRRTEIEFLNQAIAGLAAKKGQPELAQNTKLLGEIISLKSSIQGSNG